MTAGEIIGLVGGLIAAISAITAIVAFFIARGKDHYKEGSEDSGMRGDIKYMRNSFDDLRLDVKEVARKQDNQGERLTRVEESCKQAHKRIDSIENRHIGGDNK